MMFIQVVPSFSFQRLKANVEYFFIILLLFPLNSAPSAVNSADFLFVGWTKAAN